MTLTPPGNWGSKAPQWPIGHADAAPSWLFAPAFAAIPNYAGIPFQRPQALPEVGPIRTILDADVVSGLAPDAREE